MLPTRCISSILAASLCGCLHSPATPEERRTGIDLVGMADSTSPIRAGVSSREEVIKALGEPQQVSPDRHAIAYEYEPIVSRAGFVFIGGPCGLRGYYPSESRIKESLWLAFDDRDTLQWYLSSRDRNDVDWQTFCNEATASHGAIEDFRGLSPAANEK